MKIGTKRSKPHATSIMDNHMFLYPRVTSRNDLRVVTGKKKKD